MQYNSVSGSIALKNSGTLNITGITQSVGSLTIINTGDITQSGAMSVLGTSSFTAGANIINLNSSSNALTGIVTLSNSGAKTVTLANTGLLLNIGASTFGSGAVNITNTGALTTSGSLTSSGGDINLTTLSPDVNVRVLTVSANILSNGGDITLTGANNTGGTATALIVNGILNTSPGTGGALTIGGGLSLLVTPVVGAGDIVLQGSGDDLTIGGLSFSTPINFTATDNIFINGTISSTASIAFTAATIQIGADINATNSNITFNGATDVTADALVDAGTGAINFNNAINGAGFTLTLQNNSGTSGNVLFSNNVTLAGLTTYAQNYGVTLTGNSNTFTNAVVFNNTGGVTLGDSVADIFNFNGGVTNTGTTTVMGTINTTNSAVDLGTVALAGTTNISTGAGSITLGGVSGSNILNLTSSTGSTLNGNINVSSLSLSGSGTDNFNGASIITSGNQTYSDAINLNSASSTFTGSAINFASTLSGGTNALTVNGGGVVTFGNAVTLASLNASGSEIDINGGSVSTSGSQVYNNAVALGADTTLTLTGGGTSNISFSNGISGNRNLTINTTGGGIYNFSLNGALALNNISIAPSVSTNNSLAINNGGSATWQINGLDFGAIAGLSGVTGTFDFSNIQNLTGGNNGNTFVVADNASMSGTVNGGSLANINTLNYAAYNGPINVLLSSLNAGTGTILNNVQATVIAFTNMNAFTSNSINNMLTLANETNNLTVTSVKYGYINDPTYFNSFQTITSSGGNDRVIFNVPTTLSRSGNVTTANMNGTNMYFVGFNFNAFSGNIITPSSPPPTTQTTNVPAVIQQGSNPSPSGGGETTYGIWTDIIISDIDSIAQQEDDDYKNEIGQLRVTTNCFTTQ